MLNEYVFEFLSGAVTVVEDYDLGGAEDKVLSIGFSARDIVSAVVSVREIENYV